MWKTTNQTRDVNPPKTVTRDSALAKFHRLAHPSFSWCLRCGFPWAVVKEHVTHYGHGSGCFPLCQECWGVLGCPEARIEYYKNLIDWWESNGRPISEDRKRDIQRAVANGG